MNSQHRPARRRGSILIVAMLVVFALAGLVLVMGRTLSTEAIASSNAASAAQASAVARGAEQFVLALLADQGAAVVLAMDETEFQAVPVGAGWFWIVRPDVGDDALPLFGLVDEGGKVNFNRFGYDELMKLPGMTDDVAGAIVDWRDEDDQPTSGGAESATYAGLANPYQAKNAPFETVEELLLVNGMTRDRLYGSSPREPLGTRSSARTSTNKPLGDAQLARGWFDLLTVYSAEAPGNVPLPPGARGRMNVYTAPREALLCLPGVEAADVDKIIAARPAAGGSEIDGRQLIANALGPDRVTTLAPFVMTGASTRYSADIVAVSGNGRAFRRVRVVVDVSGPTTPRIIYRRDLSERGWPMDPQVLRSIRAGNAPTGSGLRAPGSRLGAAGPGCKTVSTGMTA